MSILTSNNIDPAAAAADQIIKSIQNSFVQLSRAGKVGYNLIWNNVSLTPQQVVTALGSNAQVVFELANLNVQTVTQAATLAGSTPPTLPSVPSAYTLTFNPDGSGVVITNPVQGS